MVAISEGTNLRVDPTVDRDERLPEIFGQVDLRALCGVDRALVGQSFAEFTPRARRLGRSVLRQWLDFGRQGSERLRFDNGRKQGENQGCRGNRDKTGTRPNPVSNVSATLNALSKRPAHDPHQLR
jgi:hypothetical protein